MLKPVKGWDYEGYEDRNLAFQKPVKRSYWDIAETAVNTIFITGIAALQIYVVAFFAL